MTIQEFSNEFDILYNNIMSNAAPGLTEYEKSVFLTKAQSEIIRAYFSNKGNKFQEGFDDSEKRQYDFSNLIRVSSLSRVEDSKLEQLEQLDRRSQVFLFPVDYFLSVNELIVDSTGSYYSVIPLKHEEYQRLMLKPYAYPVKRGAWRMFTNTLLVLADPSDTEGKKVQVPVAEIIGRFSEDITYQLRYVRKPKPIVLENLGEELSIDGEHLKSDCELSSELHSEILQRAVELAKAAYIGDLNSQIALGQTSETNMGIVAQSR